MRKLWFVVFLAVFSTCVSAQTDTGSKSVPGKKDAVLSEYGKLPLSFERNAGQADEHVKFVFHGSGLSLFLTNNEAVIALKKASPLRAKAKGEGGNPLPIPNKSESATVATVGMQLLGANSALRPEGAEELPGKANYFIGNDPSKWRTNVPTYAKVKYEHVYPGVDLVYYGHEGRLEYDFVVAPGADPQRIRLKVRGAGRLHVDESGDLRLGAAGSELRLEKPVIYQTAANGEKKAVEGGYVVKGRQVRFEVARYDHDRALVIDPTLVYSTYLGGGAVDLNGGAIAIDPAGNAYVTAPTASPFPTTSGAFQSTFGGTLDAFVSKLNADGSALVYSTYLGGSNDDYSSAIAVDTSGNAYITGNTFSSNFPGKCPTTGSFSAQAFVSKLNAAGSALIYSVCLGPGAGSAITIDQLGNAYVTGGALGGFPTTPGAIKSTYSAAFNFTNGFVYKLNADGSAPYYSTYLGGSFNDFGISIAIDAAGNAYVAGYTNSTDFPTTTGAFQTTFLGSADTFVSKLNANGSALIYSTFLGMSEGGSGVALDASGNAFVTGRTDSPDFPTTPGAFQVALGGTDNAFVSKLNARGSALIYSTYLGGSGQDYGTGIAVDDSGNAYIAGWTTSSNFPTTPDALQLTYGGGGVDAFMSKLNSTGSALLYSTYLGGNDSDWGRGIAIDGSGNAYVVGGTESSNFPTTPGAFQATSNGKDAFVTKIAFETVRSLKESVLSQLEQLLSSSTKGEEREKLREAIKDLSDSLAPALWAPDGNHLNFPWGREVFEKEERAVRELSELIHDKKSTISAEVLQGYISSLVKADRMLANTAISGAAGVVDPNEIARANARLAEGDEDATAGRADEAISDYKEAWLIISLCLDKKEK